jgi:peptidoglycan lytic transglycosylase D
MNTMKRAFLVGLTLFIIGLLTLPLSYCGGKQAPVKTEPTQTTPSDTSESDKSDDSSRERIKNKDKSEENTDTKENSEMAPVEESPLERRQIEIVTSLEQEYVPVIIPKEKPPLTDPESIEGEKTIKIADSISSGITDIFRGFGYKGAIDVPENFKRRVAHYIRYFSENEKGTRFYRRAMSRGSVYFPMIKKVLKKKHLPLSLAYLPVIESGFNLNARSRARAIGMWQFMKGTARMYGLKVNRRVDERRDPVKSTYAAAEYLNDLLAMFGAEDPFLGISAYNAGEGKIMRALRKISYKERSFWTLVKKNLLKNETDEYIPRLLAVVLIANDPVKYAAASKTVPRKLLPEEAENEDQEVIGSLLSSKDNLGEIETKSMNTHAKPKAVLITKPPKVKPVSKGSTIHRVKRGDTLYNIARRYKVSVKRLKQWNKLRSNNIKVGWKLKIKSATSPVLNAKSRRTRSSKGYRLVYTVNYTDSLARIALFFKGVSARSIMRWNNLRRSRIYPKQKLAIYLKHHPRKVFTHIVKRGESARTIARKYKRRIEYVLSLNGLLTNSRLKPGKRLKIYYF